MLRQFASNQCGPGSNPGVDAICGLIEFVAGSLPSSERFFSGLAPLLKTNTSNGTFKRVHKNSRVLRNKLLFTEFFFFFCILMCFTLHLYATFLSASFQSIKKVCFLSIYLDHRVRTEALGCTKAHQKAIQKWPLLQNNEHFM